MLWQGGFLFYAAFVVPTGTRVLGSAAVQGQITARVTHSLNLVGVVALALMLTDMFRGKHVARFTLWLMMVVLHAWLFFVHAQLDGLMDPSRSFVYDRDSFYPLHRNYLISSTVQWATGLAWMGLTLKSWFAPPK